MRKRTILKIFVGLVVAVVSLTVLFALILLVSVSILNRTNGTIVSSSYEREYLLYVPESYDSSRVTPLVISLHGAMAWPSLQMGIDRWNEAADEDGFIVVYPSGTGFGPKSWEMEGSETPSKMPDVVFISELIDTLKAAYNIDPNRIYVGGLSNGGGMAYVLSCTLSDRIAAIAVVAAAQSLPWSWCLDSTPVPMIAFHGTADPIVPFVGGKMWMAPAPFPSVRSWVANWARRNRCAPTPVESQLAADVTRAEYTGCAEDAAVVLYTIQGGGHAWPGGKPLPKWLVGSTSSSVSATRQSWAFFGEHRLPTR